jgi:YidC/Oxa1 family membrane protein insertase
MDKNTVWAIVLSTIVLFGFMAVQTVFFPPKPSAEKTAAESSVSAEKTEESQSIPSLKKETASVFDDVKDQEVSSTEKNYTITTDRVKVTFTNRGGDIIYYELLNHHDNKTGKGVQMADNISADDRLAALSFGGEKNQIINDIFTAKIINDYKIGFYRKFSLKNDDGSVSSFTLVKQYTFEPDDYVFKLDVFIDGDENFKGLDFQGTAYTLRTSPQIGPHFDKSIDRYENRQFIAYSGEKAKRITLGTNQFKAYDKDYKWAGIAGKYFETLVIPESSGNMENVYYSTLTEVNNYANAQALLLRNPVKASEIQDTYYFYIGPRNEKDLKIYNVSDLNKWNLSDLKLTESLQTSGFLSWIETILKWLMELIYKVIPNWGLSIIILTVLLKLAMFPVTKKTSLGTLKMQDIQPKMTALQEKYKDNQQKLQEETAKLYKEAGYNPVSGCLPMIVQFVILFAMYNLFNNYFEFRGALFIPGWIPDLSSGDSVLTFGFSIPFLGNHLRLLPIIYLISQLFFGKITQNGGTTGVGTSKTQMNIMMYGMPIFFFFLFYNAPSGLLIYWTVSNLMQMGQQLVINRMMAQKKEEMRIEKSSRQRTYPPKKR